MSNDFLSPLKGSSGETLFAISAGDLRNVNQRYRPVKRTSAVIGKVPDTRVKITSLTDQNISLVATFVPKRRTNDGVKRVAGKQIVNTTAFINFGLDLPIHWMASVLRQGDISPNVSTQPYSNDNDVFSLKFNQQITLKHNADGIWEIPPFHPSEYTVDVGFGLGTQYIAWGYSVRCQPNQSQDLRAQAYQLLRSDEESRIGDPIVPNPKNNWKMMIGQSYLLSFSNRGVGTLTRR